MKHARKTTPTLSVAATRAGDGLLVEVTVRLVAGRPADLAGGERALVEAVRQAGGHLDRLDGEQAHGLAATLPFGGFLRGGAAFPASRMALHRADGRHHVLRGRVIGRETWPCLYFQRAAILIECRSLEISPSAGDRLQHAFGLTPAEAAVALAFAEDMTVAEIAQQRGVSEETVKSQSRAILRKTGASRRSALTRVVAKLSD